MSYSPVVPFGGYSGWKILNRTMETQKAAYVASADVKSDAQYFRENIGKIDTAEQLVADRRLLKVALGAFGLQDDIDNKFFIKKVLSDGTLDNGDLANKLSNKSYLAMSQAFGFGDYKTPSTKLSDFADTILKKYETQSFEVAVGENNESFRLAMYAQREIPALAQKDMSENAKWYSIIGSGPMSTVMRSALGLPSSVGALDVDKQLDIYKTKAKEFFGTSDPAKFANTEGMDKMVKMYLLRSDLDGTSTYSGGSAALSLLQGTAGGSAFSSDGGASILSLLV